MRFILLIVATLNCTQQLQLAHNKCQRLNNILIEINYSQLEHRQLKLLLMIVVVHLPPLSNILSI